MKGSGGMGKETELLENLSYGLHTSTTSLAVLYDDRPSPLPKLPWQWYIVLFPDSHHKEERSPEAIVGGTYPTMHNLFLEQWCRKEAETKAQHLLTLLALSEHSTAWKGSYRKKDRQSITYCLRCSPPLVKVWHNHWADESCKCTVWVLKANCDLNNSIIGCAYLLLLGHNHSIYIGFLRTKSKHWSWYHAYRYLMWENSCG